MKLLAKDILLLLACIASAIPHMLAVLNFKRRLAVKRRALISLLSDPDILDRYKGQFPARQGLSDAESIAKDYFATYYSRREYLSALALNFITGCVALLFVTARIGFPSPMLGQHVVALVQNAAWGNAVLWSLTGSYLWNCYDLIRRTTNFNLTPNAFTRMWLKLWIAAAVASIISSGITTALQPTVGFAIGLISIPVLFEIISDRASKVLNVKSTEGDANTPIKVLQGASSNVIDTLNDIDIESTVQLAYCDPMNVMMSTNLPWVVIIDMIDQALLFNYIGPDIAKIRSGGYRGSIEVATIGAHLNGGADQRIVGLRSLSNFATLLGWSESKAIDLVQTLYADSQLNLIWDLFGGNFATRDKMHVPDAETVKMVIKADLSAAADLGGGGGAKDAAQQTSGEIGEKIQQVVAQNRESQILSSKEEFTITMPAALRDSAGETMQK
jgi:hypothetical protein